MRYKGLSVAKKIALEMERRLQMEVIREHPLTQLFWECTLRCDLKCRHCGSDCKTKADSPDMPLEDFLGPETGAAQSAPEKAGVPEMLREQMPAAGFPDQFRRHLRDSIADELLPGMLFKEMVEGIRILQGKVHPGNQVIISIGLARCGGGLEKGQFRLYLGYIPPPDVYPPVQDMYGGLLGCDGRQDGHFRIEMDEKVIPRIVQGIDQLLKQAELVVCDDQEGVFHHTKPEIESFLSNSNMDNSTCSPKRMISFQSNNAGRAKRIIVLVRQRVLIVVS